MRHPWWSKPLLIGLAATATLWYAVPESTPGEATGPPVAPIAAGLATPEVPLQLLLIGDAPEEVRLSCLHEERRQAYTVAVEPMGGVAHQVAFRPSEGAWCQLGKRFPHDGPTDEVMRLGANASGVTATAYAFDAEGLLVASNRPLDHARHGDYTGLPDATWYLGNGTAPEGMRELPILHEEAGQWLWGRGVGSVVVVETDALWDLYNMLYIVVQVNAVHWTD